jgi:Family of unknown function (DUF6498)
VPRFLPASEELRRPSVIALLVANLVPMYGVFVLGWEVFPLILLFWLENIVIGVVNVLKILTARPDDRMWWVGKAFLIPFFIVHYGGFTFVHGIFVFALFGGATPFAPADMSASAVLHTIRSSGVLWGALALLASHGLSFVTNYLGAGEYRNADPKVLMGQPYARVIVLHLTIIFGGFVMVALGSPRAGLLLLVLLKIGMDLRAHLTERRTMGSARPAAA